jgi:putative flippase GtrA
MRQLILNKKTKYLVVMILGFFLDLVFYITQVKFGSPYLVANLNSYLVGSFICVLLLRKYVFIHPKFNLIKDYSLTVITNGSVFILGSLLLWIIANLLADQISSKIIVNFVTFLINYFIRVKFF